MEKKEISAYTATVELRHYLKTEEGKEVLTNMEKELGLPVGALKAEDIQITPKTTPN